MTGQDTAVFGIFKTASKAVKAVGRLTSAGFSHSDVCLQESNVDRRLSSRGIPEHPVERYEEYLKEGSILLSVHCSNSLEVDRANTILEQNGAEDISLTREEAVGNHGVRKP